MTNPFDLAYLTTASSQLGPFAWAFLILQGIGALMGLYLKFGRHRYHIPVAWLDRALIVLGGIGIILGGLRLGDVSIFNQRFWLYLVLVVELGLAAYVIYIARQGQATPKTVGGVSRIKSAAGRRAAQAVASRAETRQNGSATAPSGHSTHTTSRREARRGRKRKHR